MLRGAPPQTELAADLLTLLNALRTLQDDYAVNGLSSRSLIPQVMQRLEHEARQGAGQIQATSFHQMLRDLQAADAQCLDSIRQQLPDVAQNLSRLRMEGLTALEPGNMLSGCIQTSNNSRALPRRRMPPPLVTFLAGLQSFLSLIVQRRIVTTSQRVHWWKHEFVPCWSPSRNGSPRRTGTGCDGQTAAGGLTRITYPASRSAGPLTMCRIPTDLSLPPPMSCPCAVH